MTEATTASADPAAGHDPHAALKEQLPALADGLAALGRPFPADAMEILPTRGLAHDHVRLPGTGLLLRVPRQSQMRLSAARNLAYQAACFDRFAASGHTPALAGMIEPGVGRPMGALVVEEVLGRASLLPDDLPAIARALAALHALPVPSPDAAPPLVLQEDPGAATLAEVRAQGAFLAEADLPDETRSLIVREIDAAQASLDATAGAVAGPPQPVVPVSFDAHPGNFILRDDGRAVLVDLEKGRYGGPGFDLAHATLYTSTTWDVETYAELDRKAVAAFYRAWLEAVPVGLAAASRPWLLDQRRLMWLWSVTWCAKWSVESGRSLRRDKLQAASTEDWSAEATDTALIAHVAGRVRHYLEPATIRRVLSDWAADSPIRLAVGD